MTDHYGKAEKLASDAEHAGTWQLMTTLATVAQVHATLAAAPRPWLRCVDQLHGTGHYRLNPMYIVYVDRHEDGWLQAIDATGRAHQIASDDEAKAEALIGGQP